VRRSKEHLQAQIAEIATGQPGQDIGAFAGEEPPDISSETLSRTLSIAMTRVKTLASPGL